MDTQDIRTLKILEEIDQDESPSQRDLATTLNVSLGLVNSFIKRLAKKGYFKITTIPANRVRYMLTPKGMAEKTRLTYEYLQYSFHFYREVRKRLDAIFLGFKTDQVRRILFFGAGELAEIAYLSLQGSDIRLVGIVDENRIGDVFLGHRVIGRGDISILGYDRILVTAPGEVGAIAAMLESIEVPRSRVVFI